MLVSTASIFFILFINKNLYIDVKWLWKEKVWNGIHNTKYWWMKKTTCHQKYKQKASEILSFFRAKSILRALNSQSGTSCVWHLHLPFREDRSGVFWVQKEMMLTLPSSYCCPVSTTVTQEIESKTFSPSSSWFEQCGVFYFPAILHLATGTFPWVNDREWFLLHLFFSGIMKWENLPVSFNSNDEEWPFPPYVWLHSEI